MMFVYISAALVALAVFSFYLFTKSDFREFVKQRQDN